MKQTVQTLQAMKERGEKIAMLTCYDYTTAKLMDEAGMDMLLVGDSLGNVILGYSDTISVTMEDMIHHTAAVSRGVQNAMVVADMPFLSYQTSVYDAVVNAGRLMKEGRAGAANWKSCQRSGKWHTWRQWCVYRHKFKIHSVCSSFFFARLDK